MQLGGEWARERGRIGVVSTDDIDCSRTFRSSGCGDNSSLASKAEIFAAGGVICAQNALVTGLHGDFQDHAQTCQLICKGFYSSELGPTDQVS